MRYTIILALLLSGCATVTPNPWIGLDTDLSIATTPIHCVMPLPDEVIGQSIVYETSVPLEAYRVCSEANEDIVSEHALQIHQLKLARKGLTEAGQAQRRIADMKQTMLNDERRHNLYMSVGYWVVILGLAL